MERNARPESCALIAVWALSAVVALNLNNIAIIEGMKIFRITITITTSIITITYTTPKIHQRVAVYVSVWITRRKILLSPIVRVISTVT